MVNFIFYEVPVFHFLVSGERVIFRFHTLLQKTAKFRNKANLKSEKWILFTLNILDFLFFYCYLSKCNVKKVWENEERFLRYWLLIKMHGEILRISLYAVRMLEMRTRITPNTDTFYTVKRKKKQIFLIRFYMFFRGRKLLWILYLKLLSRSPGGGM